MYKNSLFRDQKEGSDSCPPARQVLQPPSSHFATCISLQKYTNLIVELMNTPSAPQYQYSRRLYFAYDKEKISLISQKRLKMTPLPSHQITSDSRHSGFWYELKDKKGRTLYRRITKNPLLLEIEIHTGDPKQPFKWQKNKEAKGEFTLLIPDLPDAHEIIIMGTKSEEKPSLKPAEELARIPLSEKIKEENHERS